MNGTQQNQELWDFETFQIWWELFENSTGNYSQKEMDTLGHTLAYVRFAEPQKNEEQYEKEIHVFNEEVLQKLDSAFFNEDGNEIVPALGHLLSTHTFSVNFYNFVTPKISIEMLPALIHSKSHNLKSTNLRNMYRRVKGHKLVEQWFSVEASQHPNLPKDMVTSFYKKWGHSYSKNFNFVVAKNLLRRDNCEESLILDTLIHQKRGNALRGCALSSPSITEKTVQDFIQKKTDNLTSEEKEAGLFTDAEKIILTRSGACPKELLKSFAYDTNVDTRNRVRKILATKTQ